MTAKVLSGALEVSGPISGNGQISTGGAYDLVARSGLTGGGNVLARHAYLGGSIGGLHILDDSGNDQFSLMLDAQPATAVNFNLPQGGTIPISLNLSTGLVTFLFGVSGILNCVSSTQGEFYGQSSDAGIPPTLAIFGGKNSVGTVKGSMSISLTGKVTFDNPSSLAVAASVTSGGFTAKTIGQPTENNIGTVTTTATVNWPTNGAAQKLTLTSATGCTVSFTTPSGIVGWYTLKVTSPASGTVPAITWPATVKWPGGTAIAAASTLGRSNIYRFYFDGTNYWGDAIVNAA